MTPPLKKRKVDKGLAGSSSAMHTSVDLTTPNSQQQSPLFRLPAELRNKIWGYAYDDMEVCVHSRYCYNNYINPAHPLALGYSLSNDSIGNPLGFVCKQHWIETSGRALARCTFYFEQSSAFRAFLRSGDPIVPHVQRVSIGICLDGDRADYSAKTWAKILSRQSLVGKLKSLEGVALSVESDQMASWRDAELPAIIRFFQQHKEKEERTSVLFFGAEVEDDEDHFRCLEDAVRMHLLDYQGDIYAGNRHLNKE